MKAIMVHNWWLQTDNKPFFLKRLFHLLVSEKRVVIELKMYIRRFFWERCEGVYSSILSTSNIQFYCVYFGYLQKKKQQQ